MLTNIQNVKILAGNTVGTSTPGLLKFAPSGQYGDWGDPPGGLKVGFPDGAFEATDRLRVIVTPAAPDPKNPDHSAHVPAPVCLATNVDRNGFIIRARNSDVVGGKASFNWLAVGMPPPIPPPPPSETPVALRLGRLHTQNFADSGEYGDWHVWDNDHHPWHSCNLLQDPRHNVIDNAFVLLTAADHGAGGRAVVGTVTEVSSDISNIFTFTPACRNSDISGRCGFHYVVTVNNPDAVNTGPDINLWVDSGVVGSVSNEGIVFLPAGERGDWQWWSIYFEKPFLTPPIVLLTANDVDDPNRLAPIDPRILAAPVGVVSEVHADFFRLNGRNSDVKSGRNGFYWVAFGCAPGCGQG